MSVWFSEYRVRCLAERIAPRIAPKVEAALVLAIKSELPSLLLEALQAEIPEHAPKRQVSARRDRNAAIRADFNGRNARELAVRFGISVRQVWRIVSVR